MLLGGELGGEIHISQNWTRGVRELTRNAYFDRNRIRNPDSGCDIKLAFNKEADQSKENTKDNATMKRRGGKRRENEL